MVGCAASSAFTPPAKDDPAEMVILHSVVERYGCARVREPQRRNAIVRTTVIMEVRGKEPAASARIADAARSFSLHDSRAPGTFSPAPRHRATAMSITVAIVSRRTLTQPVVRSVDWLSSNSFDRIGYVPIRHHSFP